MRFVGFLVLIAALVAGCDLEVIVPYRTYEHIGVPVYYDVYYYDTYDTYYYDTYDTYYYDTYDTYYWKKSAS